MAQRVRKRYRGQYALRLPYNSPFQQHFTQGFLLCSGGSIHHMEEIVKTLINIFLSNYAFAARSALGSPERGAGSPNGLTEGFSRTALLTDKPLRFR